MENLLETLKKIGIVRLSILFVMVVGMLGITFTMYSRISTQEMALIYGGIETQDAAKIVSKLESLGIPFQIKGDGSQIYVPANQAARIRMLMAEAGLPSGGASGYEILDRTDNLGTTSFLQDINYLRALEGELAKTIKTISGIIAARVHLVLPKKELFSKNPTAPSASIIIKMNTVQRLNTGQVRAIQHLVSSGVVGLNPQRISIIDDQGTLLARGSEKEDGGSDGDEHQAQTEGRYAKLIESLLERSLGPGKVRAEVSLDMEHDRVTENSEIFDPNGQVVRSTQNVEDGNSSNEKNLESNVSIQNALPNQGQSTPSADNKFSQKSKRNEETINYEISKTLRSSTREGGKIKRLSVAVLVDGSYKQEKDQQVYVPRAKTELEQIATLVKSAIGFKAERGDTVEIINMKFADPPAVDERARTDTIFGLEKYQFLRLVEIILIAIAGLIALISVIRPITLKVIEISKDYLPPPPPRPQYVLQPEYQPAPPAHLYQQERRNVAPPPPPPPVDQPPPPQAFDEDEEISLDRIEGSVKRANIKKVEELIDRYPAETLNAVRSWMNTTD